MFDGFTLQNWIYPFPDRWAYMATHGLEALRLAAGYRYRQYATDLLTLPPDLDTTIPLKQTRDFYINLKPGSRIYEVQVYAGEAANAGLTDVGLQVEIIDTCTKETLWETSKVDTLLSPGGWTDDAAGVTAETAAYTTVAIGDNRYRLAVPHLVEGTGIILVRLTNQNPNDGAGTPASLAPQVVLSVSERIPQEAII